MIEIVSQLAKWMQQHQYRLAVAESCTGGLISKIITDLPGSSVWFERGFITYSNQAKIDMLGVCNQTLDRYGAVSLEVASEMARGALKHSLADIALSVTGVAGPEGGTIDKPVGTVCFSWAYRERRTLQRLKQFKGNRNEIREQSALFALENVLKMAHENGLG